MLARLLDSRALEQALLRAGDAPLRMRDVGQPPRLNASPAQGARA